MRAVEDENVNDGFQQWTEAMDPNQPVAPRPVPQAVVASLPRKLFVTVQAGIDTSCTICVEAFTKDQVVVVLGCGHMFCDGACIEQWLATSDDCPICRTKVVGTLEDDSAAADGDAETSEVEEKVKGLKISEDKAAKYGGAVPGAWVDGTEEVGSP